MQIRPFVARRVVVPAALLAVLVAAGPAAGGGSSTARSEAGMGVAAVFANLFYVPMKLGYAAIGGLTGGLGWAVSGGKREVADRIWVASIGGDYVLTREMLAGKESIHFIGTTEAAGPAATADAGKHAGSSIATVRGSVGKTGKPTTSARASAKP